MDSSPFSPIAAGAAMSDDDIAERSDGVYVYGLNDSENHFVLEMDENSAEPQVKLYFNEKDAKKSLQAVQTENPTMFSNLEVASFALSDVLKLMDDDGSRFRLIPESKQIRKAVKRRRWDGILDDRFPGVPVFKPTNLVVTSEDGKSYCPVYFRLEDLHKSRAKSTDKMFLYPVLKVGDFEVADLEEMIRGMKDDSNTDWDDVMFIAPGYDLPVYDKPLPGFDLPADQSSDKPPADQSSDKPPAM